MKTPEQIVSDLEFKLSIHTLKFAERPTRWNLIQLNRIKNRIEFWKKQLENSKQ